MNAKGRLIALLVTGSAQRAIAILQSAGGRRDYPAAHTRLAIFWLFALAILIAPGAVSAKTWRATVGAQSTDEGIQALAFLPNELWIRAGDSITWTFPAHAYGDFLTTKFSYQSPAGSTGAPRSRRRLSSAKSDANDAKWLQFRWLQLRDLRR